jgi:heme-degrading monooxygenase HmoA
MAAENAGSHVFRVILRMEIVSGGEHDFEQTWLDVGGAITGQAANLGQWLMRSYDESGVYYIISDWIDEARFREFEGSDEHLSHRRRLHPFRTSGSMVTTEIVAALQKTVPQRAGPQKAEPQQTVPR